MTEQHRCREIDLSQPDVIALAELVATRIASEQAEALRVAVNEALAELAERTSTALAKVSRPMEVLRSKMGETRVVLRDAAGEIVATQAFKP